LIDYARVAIPNVGGLTEFMKIAALCETHYVRPDPALHRPDFGGGAGSCRRLLLRAGPDGDAATGNRADAASPRCFDFRNGKLWPNERPGLGVEFDASQLTEITAVSEYAAPMPIYRRPDGSITNW